MPLHMLTLRIPAQAAEGVSDALLAAGAHSVALEDLECASPTVIALLPAGSDAQRLLANACAAAGLPVAPPCSVKPVAEADWVRASQAQFSPLEVGARLWIGSSWHTPAGGRACVRLDPGLAFGTGAHPSTRLVLEFLEGAVHGGESVLDYGCGSGILAIAAAKLGAARVDAVDVDPEAVLTAAANARSNGVAVRVALADSLAPGRYDIVAANILARPLIVLAPLLAARTAPRGRIALGGILESQADEVAAAYAPWFTMGLVAGRDGWALLSGERR